MPWPSQHTHADSTAQRQTSLACLSRAASLQFPAVSAGCELMATIWTTRNHCVCSELQASRPVELRELNEQLGIGKQLDQDCWPDNLSLAVVLSRRIRPAQCLYLACSAWLALCKGRRICKSRAPQSTRNLIPRQAGWLAGWLVCRSDLARQVG